jgi:hypothetical protein
MKYLLVVSMQCLMKYLHVLLVSTEYTVSLYIKVEINGKINVHV